MSTSSQQPAIRVSPCNHEAPATLDRESLDTFLAAYRPFSDPQYLFDRTLKRYSERLGMVAARIPIASEVACALQAASPACCDQVLTDPVMRAAINQALAIVSFDGNTSYALPDIQKILEMGLRQLQSNTPVPVLQLGAGDAPEVFFGDRRIWLWSNERHNDLPSEFLKGLYEKQEEQKSLLVTPTDGERLAIIKALNLLAAVLPRLTNSVLKHVSLICVADTAIPGQALYFSSLTTILVPGALFLGRSILQDVWLTAEAILHEALHLKLYDFQNTHLLFTADSEFTVPITRALWNRPGAGSANQWVLNRSFFAFHVYVHLAIYFTMLAEKAPELEPVYGPSPYDSIERSARRAFDRAHYLGYSISKCSHRLGAAGRALLNWLNGILSKNDPAPPVYGSSIHLLLDLYERETQQILKEHARGRTPQFASGSRLKAELALAQFIFANLNSPLVALDAERLAALPTTETVQDIATARTCLASLLGRISLKDSNRPVQLAFGNKATIGELVEALVLDPEKYLSQLGATKNIEVQNAYV